MPIHAIRLRRVLEGEAPLVASDADAVLEIACLTIAADRRLHDDELAGLRVLAAEVHRLAGEAPRDGIDDAELESLVSRFAGERARDAAADRLRALGDAMTSTHGRRIAYKVSMALAACDSDAADEEFELDLDMLDALRLSSDDANRLAAEVETALKGR